MRDICGSASYLNESYCHQAFYITNAILRHVISLGDPLSSALLTDMPVDLVRLQSYMFTLTITVP